MEVHSLMEVGRQWHRIQPERDNPDKPAFIPVCLRRGIHRNNQGCAQWHMAQALLPGASGGMQDAIDSMI